MPFLIRIASLAFLLVALVGALAWQAEPILNEFRAGPAVATPTMWAVPTVVSTVVTAPTPTSGWWTTVITPLESQP